MQGKESHQHDRRTGAQQTAAHTESRTVQPDGQISTTAAHDRAATGTHCQQTGTHCMVFCMMDSPGGYNQGTRTKQKGE